MSVTAMFLCVLLAAASDLRAVDLEAAARLESQIDVLIVNLNLSADSRAGAEGIARVLEGMRAGLRTRIVHYLSLDDGLLGELRPRGVVLSPQKDPWWTYPKEDIERLASQVRKLEMPVLGVCGGHQFLALAFGGRVAPIEGEAGPAGYAGLRREKGVIEIEVVADSVLLKSRRRGDHLRVIENHVEEIKELPSEFELVAQGTASKLQFVQHKTRPIFGVQFHPERFDKKNGDGRFVLEAFLDLVLSQTEGGGGP
jgi:GMP synthase (glutamine-hydrolysing)